MTCCEEVRAGAVLSHIQVISKLVAALEAQLCGIIATVVSEQQLSRCRRMRAMQCANGGYRIRINSNHDMTVVPTFTHHTARLDDAGNVVKHGLHLVR